eukprot:6174300-Pleurochrysis_carterae.AAC.2
MPGGSFICNTFTEHVDGDRKNSHMATCTSHARDFHLDFRQYHTAHLLGLLLEDASEWPSSVRCNKDYDTAGMLGLSPAAFNASTHRATYINKSLQRLRQTILGLGNAIGSETESRTSRQSGGY